MDGMPSHSHITHHYDLIQDRDTLDTPAVHVSQSLELEVSLRSVAGCCTQQQQQQLTSSSARLLPNAAYGGEDLRVWCGVERPSSSSWTPGAGLALLLFALPSGGVPALPSHIHAAGAPLACLVLSTSKSRRYLNPKQALRLLKPPAWHLLIGRPPICARSVRRSSCCHWSALLFLSNISIPHLDDIQSLLPFSLPSSSSPLHQSIERTSGQFSLPASCGPIILRP
jgi:hypothetical protein